MATPLSSLPESQFSAIVSDMFRDAAREVPHDMVMKLMCYVNTRRVLVGRKTVHVQSHPASRTASDQD